VFALGLCRCEILCHVEGRIQAEGVPDRVLRGISGSEREEVTGDWRKLHSEELHNLYSSENTNYFDDHAKEDEFGSSS
jgi:hypothetical protein